MKDRDTSTLTSEPAQTQAVVPSPTVVRRARQQGLDAWHAAGVAVGAALILVTAARQPLNWDEYAQVGPYGSDSLSVIISGTRQPPLGPLLGALVEHLLGPGRFQHHLDSALAGIGALVVFALLMRSLRLGAAGAVGTWALATAPLMVRYSAYARPYALPLFGMLMFTYATHRWLETGRRGFLVLSAGVAMALPLARLPEPCVFLVTAAVALCWSAWAGRYSWSRVVGPVMIALASVTLVGLPLALQLRSKIGGRVVDGNPLTALLSGSPHRRELVTELPGLLATWFPWWPLTLAVALTALLLPAARRRWTAWWFWLPFLAAPTAFALVFHLLVQRPFLTYAPRYAYPFVIVFATGIVAVAAAALDRRTPLRLRLGLSALLVAALLTPLPTTALVLVRNEAPDWTRVARLVTEELPDDAFVVYDNPSSVGRAAFSARYDDAWHPEHAATVRSVGQIAHNPSGVTGDGAVYVLLLETNCPRCDFPQRTTPPWDRHVSGWRAHRMDLLTLYSPIDGQSGRAGVRSALEAFGATVGTERGAAMMVALAQMLQDDGQEELARATIDRLWSDLTRPQIRTLRGWAGRRDVKLVQPHTNPDRDAPPA